jgi:hypothetical protein
MELKYFSSEIGSLSFYFSAKLFCELRSQAVQLRQFMGLL